MCIFDAGSGRHRPPTSWPSLAGTRPPATSSAGWSWSAVTPGAALLGHQLRQPYLLQKAANPDDRRWSLFIFVANCTLNCVVLYVTVSESQALFVGLWHLGRCCRFWSKMHSSKWLPTLPLRHLSSLYNTFKSRLAGRICVSWANVVVRGAPMLWGPGTLTGRRWQPRRTPSSRTLRSWPADDGRTATDDEIGITEWPLNSTKCRSCTTHIVIDWSDFGRKLPLKTTISGNANRNGKFVRHNKLQNLSFPQAFFNGCGFTRFTDSLSSSSTFIKSWNDRI